MLTLYDSAFSPFARKVRIAMVLKGVEHEAFDALTRDNHDRLAQANGRIEVPVIDHDGLVVVGSSDIIAYLERRWPAPAMYPADHAAWVHARAWERCADTLIDGILINVSYWTWAVRDDRMPDGMLEAARRDFARVYAALERDLEGGDFISGPAISIADVALFPHLMATRPFRLGHDAAEFPRVHAWLGRLRAMPAFRDDLARAKAFMAGLPHSNYERRTIFWRGDRIEWLLAQGFHGWFAGELAEGRVSWPGPAIPAPRRAPARS